MPLATQEVMHVMQSVVLHVQRIATEAASMRNQHAFVIGNVVNIGHGE